MERSIRRSSSWKRRLRLRRISCLWRPLRLLSKTGFDSSGFLGFGPLCLDNRHAPSWKRFCQSKRALATIIRTVNFPFDAWEWYATDINWTHKRSYLCLGLWWKARVFQIAFEFFISYICHLSLSGLCLAPFARSLLQSYNRFFEDIHKCHSSIAIQCIDVYDTVCGLWIVNCGRC